MMAMAALPGFHVVIQKDLQRFSSRNESNLRESLLIGRGGVGDVHYERLTCRAASAAKIVPGNESSSSAKTKKGARAVPSKMKAASKAGGRGEPVKAFRDQVAVCALASAILDRVDTGGGTAVEEASRAESYGQEWSPAGDSPTSAERSRLESQWTMFLSDSIDRGPSDLELDGLREGEEDAVCEEENSAVASSSRLGEKDAVSSGKPKARLRRLEARRKKLSTAEKQTPIGAFTIFPRKRADGKSDYKKVEGVQNYVSTYMREITKIDRLTGDEEVMLSKLIRAGYLIKEERKKLERAVGHELTKQEWADRLHMRVAELEAKLHEAELARDRMVMANLRLVVSIVKQYNCEGLEAADLIQEGTIGLLKGVEKFDHARGYKLSTYVHWWIRQGVTRAIADHSRTVRLPVHIHDALGRICRAKAEMLQDGASATVETLGEALNLSNNQIKNALKVHKRLKSLDKQIGCQKSFLTGDSETFHNFVPDYHAENQPWAMVERAHLKGDIDKILDTHLGSREREIIKMHFGVDSEDGYPMSFENISHRYGISRERVRQLERAAKQKLQSTPHGIDIVTF